MLFRYTFVMLSLFLLSCSVNKANEEGCEAAQNCSTNPSTGDEDPAVPEPPFTSPKSYIRLMVSGHSLTDNPLVDYLEDLSTKNTNDFDYNQQIVIGSPIRVRTKGDNVNDPGFPGYAQGKNKSGSGLNIASEIRNPQVIGAGESYDTLVITENHNLLDMLQYENGFAYLRQFHDLFIEGNSSANTYLYHSWLDISKTDPAPWIAHEKKSVETWECLSSKVNLSLESVGRTDKMISLPIGGALVDLVERVINNEVSGIVGTTEEKLDMIFSDNVHMTAMGAYFVSSVVYAAIYGKSAENTTPPAVLSISTATANHLQAIAWNYINNYYNQNLIGQQRSMVSCRAHLVNEYCSSYFQLTDRAGQIASCVDLNSEVNTNGYFRWPDVNYTPLATP